ncbi:hypothetical protein E2C01_032486 [Portunus trituberculatus]|uniref:Uncharacterized protein n=1 Tax=Portunus trituberculatus TaxID=210409 RepID=A0A5B7F0E5_PORTR|nr:hypothetical protein [Portunus trituberculatus]
MRSHPHPPAPSITTIIILRPHIPPRFAASRPRMRYVLLHLLRLEPLPSARNNTVKLERGGGSLRGMGVGQECEEIAVVLRSGVHPFLTAVRAQDNTARQTKTMITVLLYRISTHQSETVCLRGLMKGSNNFKFKFTLVCHLALSKKCQEDWMGEEGTPSPTRSPVTGRAGQPRPAWFCRSVVCGPELRRYTGRVLFKYSRRGGGKLLYSNFLIQYNGN